MRVTTISLIFVICSIAIQSGCNQGRQPVADAASEESDKKPVVIDKKSEAQEDPSLLASDVLQKLKESTVLIGNFEGGELHSTGTGFVVADGKKIVTNKHVVTGKDDKADPLKIVFRPGTDKARIVQVKANAVSLYGTLSRSDKDYHKEDLAFVSIGAVVSEPLELSDSPNILETMPVWALGFPNGTQILSDQDMPSVTVHSLRLERIERAKSIATLLQLSGSPTYGNSGGPVVDREGRVLGVLQAKAREAPILFAIPSIRASKMLAGKKASNKSIAELWKQPIGGSEDSTPRTKPVQSDPGPRQSYSSILNQGEVGWSDLDGLSAFELTSLRNEPFARRGYIFKRADLRRIFSRTSWYSPRTRNLAAVQRLLTRTERKNVDFVRSYQRQTGKEF